VADLNRWAEVMCSLLALLIDDRRRWYDGLAPQLVYADLALGAIALGWLLIAALVRKKDQPFRLSPTFWYIAGPAAGGALFIVAALAIALVRP